MTKRLPKLTKESEEYLEAIYKLQKRKGFVKVRVNKECYMLNSRLAAAIWVQGENDE